jgi:rubrerythrin
MSQQVYTKNQYDAKERQRKVAWAKFYESEAQRANDAAIIIRTIGRNGANLVEKSSLPPHITDEFYEMSEALNKKYTCPICIDLVSKETIQITFCGHIFHKECIDEVKRVKPECPICRKRI